MNMRWLVGVAVVAVLVLACSAGPARAERVTTVLYADGGCSSVLVAAQVLQDPATPTCFSAGSGFYQRVRCGNPIVHTIYTDAGCTVPAGSTLRLSPGVCGAVLPYSTRTVCDATLDAALTAAAAYTVTVYVGGGCPAGAPVVATLVPACTTWWGGAGNSTGAVCMSGAGRVNSTTYAGASCAGAALTSVDAGVSLNNCTARTVAGVALSEKAMCGAHLLSGAPRVGAGLGVTVLTALSMALAVLLGVLA